MRVLLSSPVFAPSVGGLEIGSETLARGLVRLGHEVQLVTRTAAAPSPGPPETGFPFPVVRNPSPSRLLSLTRWCEVYYQHALSLRELWPLLLVPRPWAVSHHNWYTRTDGRIAWQDRLKRRLLHYAQSSIAVSHALAADLDSPSVVIPNPYRDDLFRLLPEVRRELDLIFVGRLVSDKGVDVLLEALARLAAGGFEPGLTLVGDGPEREGLEALARQLGLADRVRFLGKRPLASLPALLNAHHVLVVPSRYHEPFGVVALEGIACGCVVIASAGGGLPDAVGACGRLFPNGDDAALAGAIRELLGSPGLRAEMLRGAAAHLARHHSGVIAEAMAAELAAARDRGRFPWSIAVRSERRRAA